MKKILLTILALILTLSMVSCASANTKANAGKGAAAPKAEISHNYVEYTDVLDNISFNIPDDWSVKEASITLMVNKETGVGNNISIEFEAYDKANDPYKDMTAESFNDLFLNVFKAGGVQISNVSVEPIKNSNNVEMTKVSFYSKNSSSPDLTQTMYFVLAGDFYYIVTVTEFEQDEDLKKTFEKSLKILTKTDSASEAE